ncbi:hypothetical protein F5I97DRAFT_1830209 [Phlebopus sp. FC_14]|nr:hypothetical protein F5I97DRAFT_1830209 [Phlebopus sp. FC_14]
MRTVGNVLAFVPLRRRREQVRKSEHGRACESESAVVDCTDAARLRCEVPECTSGLKFECEGTMAFGRSFRRFFLLEGTASASRAPVGGALVIGVQLVVGYPEWTTSWDHVMATSASPPPPVVAENWTVLVVLASGSRANGEKQVEMDM